MLINLYHPELKNKIMFKNKLSKTYTIGVLLLMVLLSGYSNAKSNNAGKIWTGTWSTAPQLVEPNNMPPTPGLANNTFRQIVRVSIGGNIVRLRLSNVFSKEPVTLKSVAIAVAKEGSVVEESTQTKLKFEGKSEVTMLPGTQIVSDPLKFKLAPGSRLAITMAFGDVSATITGHPASRTTSYILTGDNVLSPDFAGAIPTDHWYIINGIDVQTSKNAGAVAVLGNSITDGRGSGTNKQNRWPDIFSQRLLENKATRNIGVLNLGIGGNCVVRGGLGPTALNRFDRDILSQNNVKWLIITIGVNDIGGIRTAEETSKVVENLISAYTQLIDKAHAKGIKVYGATILPFAKSFYDTDFRLQARDKVNEWIRTSGHYDAVIDFDALMRQSDNPKTILPDVHSGDFLHPNEAGYEKMGRFVDLGLFK
jgi:lysophospholipase L1-like esterase